HRSLHQEHPSMMVRFADHPMGPRDEAGQRVAQLRPDLPAALLEQREKRRAALGFQLGGVLPLARRDRGLDLLGQREHAREIDPASRRSADSLRHRIGHAPALPIPSQPALISRTSAATSSSAAASLSKLARSSTRDMYS